MIYLINNQMGIRLQDYLTCYENEIIGYHPAKNEVSERFTFGNFSEVQAESLSPFESQVLDCVANECKCPN